MTENASRRFTHIIEVLGLLIALGAVIAGLNQYREGLANQYKSAVWERQHEVYARLCEAAGRVATASTAKEVDEASRPFYAMVNTELALVEDADVRKHCVEYILLIVAYEKETEAATNPRTVGGSALIEGAYRISVACQKSLDRTWHPVPFADAPKDPPPIPVAAF